MFLRQSQKQSKKIDIQKPKIVLDLQNARKLHKKSHPNMSPQKTQIINNQITNLENTWNKIKVGKNNDEPKVGEIPKTKIFLMTSNSSSNKQQVKHRTITISVTNNIRQQLQNSKSISSPLTLSANKRKIGQKAQLFQRSAKSPKENKFGSPIKKYLDRFRQITKQTETKCLNSTMEIEDILFKLKNR